MDTKKANSSKVKLIIGAAAAIGVGLTAPAVAWGEARIEIEQFAPELASHQTSLDVLPELVNTADFNGRVESSRYIGDDTVAQYWISKNESQEVCLTAYIPTDEFSVAATSCASLRAFYDYGVALATTNGAQDGLTVESYLLPADVKVDTSQSSLSQAVSQFDVGGATLLTFITNSAPADEAISFEREIGGQFELRLIPSTKLIG